MLRFFIAVLLYMGSSSSVVSAGLVSKFVPDTDKKLPFSAHTASNLKKAAINTATYTAVNGGNVTRNALSAAAGAMVDAGAASVAQEIGRAYRNGAVCCGKIGRNALSASGCAVVDTVSGNLAREIGACYRNGEGDVSWLTHKVYHFVLSGTAAEFTSGDFLAGGTGATVGEVIADAMIARALEQTRTDVLEQLEDFRANYGNLPPIQDAEALIRLTYLEHLEAEQADQIQRIGRLAAAGTAFVGRMDISTADAAADLAIEYNSIASQIKVLKAWLGANYKKITYDGLNFIAPIEALGNLTQGKDVITSLAEIGLCVVPIGKVGKGLKFLAVKVLDKTGKPLIGAYKIVKGHHVFAKRAFVGHANYNAKNGLCISETMIKVIGGDHKKFTAAQRRLFTDLAKGGRPNTLLEHAEIAVECLVEGGINRSLARDITAAALKDLRRSGVKFPTDIPWKSVIKKLKK